MGDKMKKFLVGITAIAVLFTFGCAQPLADSRTVNSAVPADGTQVISGDEMAGLASVDSVDGKDVVVMSGQLSDYPIGGHIIMPDSGLTPGGRLYKVVAASDNGDGTVSLTCVDGLLEDALQDASISYAALLTNDDIVSVESGAIDARAISFSDTFDIDLGSVNLISQIEEWADADYGDSPVKASDLLKLNIGGNIKLTPVVNLDLQIEKFKTTYALFDIGVTMQTNLVIDAGLNYSWSQNIPLFKLNYGVITIMAGPVPIILQPQFDIILNVHGQIEASVKMNVSQVTELRICAENVEGEWDTSKSKASFSKPSFDGVYPKIKLAAGVSLTETAGLCLYGTLGVSLGVTEFADFSAVIMDGETSMLSSGTDYELANWEDLYVGDYLFETGVAANVNIRVSAFGFINQDFSVWGDRWVLARWQMNAETGYEKNEDTGMYGVWDFPALQSLLD